VCGPQLVQFIGKKACQVDRRRSDSDAQTQVGSIEVKHVVQRIFAASILRQVVDVTLSGQLPVFLL
jgi:hypothetical protein